MWLPILWEDINTPKDGLVEVPKNVWVGVSVEDQKTADERIPVLLRIPAAVRFVSVEPMLGGVGLLSKSYLKDHEWYKGVPGGLDWVICGGESGSGARPMHPHWVRSLRDQCQEAKVPFFFKGWGAYRYFPYYSEDGIWYDKFSDYYTQLITPSGYACYEEIDGQPYPDTFFVSGRFNDELDGRLLDYREWNEFPKEEE